MSFASDVSAFHTKFGLSAVGGPCQLPKVVHDFRLGLLTEELREYKEAAAAGNLHDQLDALVDLVYVAIGTADLHNFDFDTAWARVHAANMAKVRATSPDQSKRGSSLDVVKPAGWTAPDHSDLVHPDYWLTVAQQPKAPAPASDLSKTDSIDLLRELARRGGHPGAVAEAALLCAKKSEDYNQQAGGFIDIHNVDRSDYFPFGTVSYAQMLYTKAKRFNSLVQKQLNGQEPNFEGLRDTALDLINYAGFFAADKKVAA